MKQNMVLALLAAAVLSACGGGSDSAFTDKPNQPETDAVTAASLAVAKDAGLAVIAAGADEESYDLAADIGDTWRITFNTKTGAYRITVLSTQFGLQSQSGTAVRNVNGNRVTYTANTPVRFTLVVDTRTKTINGNITLGGRPSTVTGTGYSAPDLSKLAGTYTYFGAQRNVQGGANAEVLPGQLRIAANGSTAVICEGGTFDAVGNCAPIGNSRVNRQELTLTKNAADSLIDIKVNGREFGILNVKAGDRGPVLLIDRFGFDNGGFGNVRRTGGIYAVKSARLRGTELNGSYSCSIGGRDLGTAAASGNTLITTERVNGNLVVTRENLAYNQLIGFSVVANFDGVVTSRIPGEAISQAANILPLSSSLFVVEGDQATVLCQQTS